MDRWGDHALTCSCGGDRTVRHNAVRNICYEEAADARLRPEREKADLLPQRPVADGLPEKGNGRRPADVWLPRGCSGKGEALDFAVSSGLQSDLFLPVAEVPGFVFQRYENLKRSFKDTAWSCETQGFEFVPMVIEAHSGGCSPLAGAALDWIAKQQASCHKEAPAASWKISQRISCALHGKNGRAILKKISGSFVSAFLPKWLG